MLFKLCSLDLRLTLHSMGDIYPYDTIKIVRREHKA